MKTCKSCENYIPDEVEEDVGVCLLTEYIADSDDEACRVYKEREDE